MNPRQLCSSCTAPVHGAFLCEDCLDRLIHGDDNGKLGLYGVPGLVDDLEISLCRLAVIGSDGSGLRVRSAETPLMFNWAASEALSELQVQLQGWAVHLAVNNGLDLHLEAGLPVIDPKDAARIFPPRGRIAALALWLVEHASLIAMHPEAATICSQIITVLDHGTRVIDRPGEQRFCGPCGEEGDYGVCEEPLYAPARADQMTCRACGSEHDLDARREYLLMAAREQLITAAEASRALPGLLGEEITASAIRGYAHRGAITQYPPAPNVPKGPNGKRPPLYKVGQIVDAVLAAQEAKRKKGTRHAS